MKKFALTLLPACWLLAAVPRAQAEPWKLDRQRSRSPPPRACRSTSRPMARGGDSATLHFVSFDAAHLSFAVYDQGATGRGTLGDAMTANHCLAGTNGGYFQPDFEPVGLLVAEGKLVRGPSRARLLSGALVVTGHHIALRRSTEPLPGTHAHEAIQSGPFLVEGATAGARPQQRRAARGAPPCSPTARGALGPGLHDRRSPSTSWARSWPSPRCCPAG